jgi:hypothetical protein
MNSECRIKEPLTPSDEQGLRERIDELRTKNAHLEAENSALMAEVASLHEQISKLKSEPEFSEAFSEATGGHK